MGLEPDARLVINREVDFRSLPLTPIDFFLISRVEALGGATPPTVADVIAASGQPSDAANESLAKLIELGALQTNSAKPTPARSRPASSADGDLRKRARDRKRGLLAAQMRVAKKEQPARTKEHQSESDDSDARSMPSADEDSLPIPRDDQRPAEPVSSFRSILEVIEPVPEDDARLDPDVGVAIERQRRLLGLRDRLRHVGHYEILGLDPVDDTRAIRRAYHVISREFHPDSFYGKELGRFRAVLDDLFRRARSSYEFLLDAGRRKTLVEVFEAQVREEHERRLQAELEARSAARAAKDEARRKAEAEERERQRQAQEARRARERQRHERLRERALAERKKAAAGHAEQAAREREIGRHGTAATLFRLAHEQDPSNPDYEQQWRESLATARRQRAENSFKQGRSALAVGRVSEAARHLSEAADADPTLRNLSEAAAVISEVDPAQARSLAMAALETLQQAQARDLELDDRTVANVHQACARAFLAAGQIASAREQAERAHQLLGNKQTRALLNSIKLT